MVDDASADSHAVALSRFLNPPVELLHKAAAPRKVGSDGALDCDSRRRPLRGPACAMPRACAGDACGFRHRQP